MLLRMALVAAMLGATPAAWAAAPIVPWGKEQKAKLAERGRLLKSLPKLLEEKRFDDAIEARRRVAVLAKEVYVEGDPQTLASLRNLAALCEARGRFAEAIEARDEVRRTLARRLGEKHWQTTDARVALDYARSREKMTPPQRAQLASARSWLAQAQALSQKGDAKGAADLAAKAARATEAILGGKHPHVAAALATQGRALLAAGDVNEAERVLARARAIGSAELGSSHPANASVADDLGTIHLAKGRLPLARREFDFARRVREEALGTSHPDYAQSLARLGALARAQGRAHEAHERCDEAVRLLRAALGEGHPSLAAPLRELASVCHERGEYARALPLYRESMEIVGKTKGEKHVEHAVCVSHLALLYADMGEDARSAEAFRRATAVLEAAFGTVKIDAKTLVGAVVTGNYDRATTMENLAQTSLASGDPAKAVGHLSVATLLRSQQGPQHPSNVRCKRLMASAHLAKGETDVARGLLTALHKFLQTAPDPPLYDQLRVLGMLATIEREAGNLAESRILYARAASLASQLGPDHPDRAEAIAGQALACGLMGRHDEAITLSQVALQMIRRYLERGFDLLGDRQRGHALQQALQYLSVFYSARQRAELSPARQYAPALEWKGWLATRAALDRLARDEPKLKGQADELRAAESRLARLALRTPGADEHKQWLAQVEELTQQKERLEAALSAASSELRRQQRARRPTPAQVAAALPEGVAFVDLLEYAHFSPPEGGKGKLRAEQRLLAFVSRRGTDVAVVPLGRMEPVADAVARWRAEVEKPPTSADRRAIDSSALALRRAVWDGLGPHLGDAATVVVAPDGALCQFPLAALPGKKAGTYLIEDVAVAQVGSAAQLFALLEPAGEGDKRGKGLLAAGGIDYGEGGAYSYLGATGPEARRCRELFSKAFAGEDAALLEGKAASPAALREAVAKRPRYLHLATHGYFEPADKVERLMKGLAARDRVGLGRQQAATLSNLPGLRCGLALSGANAAPSDPEALPNVLTGDELASLDLRGCEVAVLSACQTALGDVKRSQGVVGLQRSLHAAGVRTTVTSLWCVQDAATAELMDEFYERLWGKEKLSRLEALRQAQLTILRDPERVRKRGEALLADARKRGWGEAAMRGIKGRLATDLPDGGKVEDAPKRSPEAWWAAFVLCGDWR